MSTYYLAPGEGSYVPPRPPKVWPQRPTLSLESMDGTMRIPLDGSTGWIRMPGSTGLGMTPFDVISGTIPGVAGGTVLDVRVPPRPVFLPIYCGGDGDHLSYLAKMNLLRSLVDPLGRRQFKVVGKSALTERELVVTYESGLEGSDGQDVEGLTWGKVGLMGTAYEPFARSRDDRSLEFRMAPAESPFLGVAGGTDAPWPVALSSGSVIGSGMEITIDSDVPVYPVLELVGPMDSFTGALSPVVVGPDGTLTVVATNEWSVEIPTGIPANQTLRMVTDPRMRSVRLDGALAAGRVALGSKLRAFYPGRNLLSVSAPGGTDNTRIRMSWRNLHRSLW